MGTGQRGECLHREPAGMLWQPPGVRVQGPRPHSEVREEQGRAGGDAGGRWTVWLVGRELEMELAFLERGGSRGKH